MSWAFAQGCRVRDAVINKEEGRMQTFKLALIQHASPVGSKSENLERTATWARKASKAGATLACFSELGLTGHAGHPAMVQEAEPVPEGPSVEFLCTLASDLNIYICAGIAEDDRGIHYNTQFIVGPEGYVGKQRKIHLSRDEHYYFRGGTAVPVLELPMARAGIVICYDNLFPEVSRLAAIKGAEVYLMPHAARFGKWPQEEAQRADTVKHTKAQWRLYAAARAYDNGMYVVVNNQAGRAGRKPLANHAGGILIFGPAGEVITESKTRRIEEELVMRRLSAAAFQARRESACFNLQTRRPELYWDLVQTTD